MSSSVIDTPNFSYTGLMTSPFTDFFSSSHHDHDDHHVRNNDDDNNSNSNNNGGSWQGFEQIPKFKSLAPSSIAVSEDTPTSFLATSNASFSPSIFLNSPLLNNFPSPTVGAFGGESFNNWVSSNETQQESKDDGRTNNFSFHAPNISTERWNLEEANKQTDMIISKDSKPKFVQNPPVVQMNRAQKRSEDGYCWRKYGQKQVKGSENPRSYYKCSYPNCPTKKKVERNMDGQITEIVYKGNHNHPKPQPNRRSSSSTSSLVSLGQNSNVFDASEAVLNASAVAEYSSFTPETSSISVDDDDEFDQTSGISKSCKEEENEPEAKRRKGENEGEVMSGYGSRTVREPRVIVQTTSEIDILDDGYRWRKYGQKVVKGNPNPRSYYKCTSVGCPVRKHIERASHDLRAVITTYEGKHNHEIPAARGSGSNMSSSSYNNGPVPVRPSAIATQPNNSNITNSSRSDTQSPFTLQMLQSNGNGNYGFSGFGNTLGNKEEPMDSSFLDSFLQ